MIIRILGEGQYDVAADALPRLNELDAAVEATLDVEGGAVDEAAFHDALAALLDGVRSVGVAHPDDSLVESDLILPHAQSSVEEVRDLLDDDGLIPG